MRFCRFDHGRVGVVRGQEIFDITAFLDRALAAAGRDEWGDPLVASLPALAAIPEEALRECRRLALDAVRLLSPVRCPTKIIAAGSNYGAHHQEMRADPTAGFGHGNADMMKAGLFLKATTSQVGPSEGVAVRFPERRTDHEVELVAVIGRRGAEIPRSEALGHVAGYCLGLDISVRGPEDRSFRKSIDTYTVLGPWLVTADEIDPADVVLSLYRNGDLRQHASTSEMVNDLPRIIGYASSFYTLFPGDLIFTGTPAGVGPIRPGDRLRAEGSGIGAMDVAVRAWTGPDEAGLEEPKIR